MNKYKGSVWDHRFMSEPVRQTQKGKKKQAKRMKMRLPLLGGSLELPRLYKTATFESSRLVDETAVQLCKSKVNPLLKVTSCSILSVKHTDLDSRSFCDVTKGSPKLVNTPCSRLFFVPFKTLEWFDKATGFSIQLQTRN